MDRTRELLELLREKRREDRVGILWWALGILVAIAMIAGIAYAVYRYFTPDYLEEYGDDDFEDDFDDYFEDEESKIVPMKKEASEEATDAKEETP